MKKVFFVISGIAVLACYSCTSDLVLDPSTPVVDFASPQRLAKDSKVLSLDDAVLLTDLYGAVMVAEEIHTMMSITYGYSMILPILILNIQGLVVSQVIHSLGITFI